MDFGQAVECAATDEQDIRGIDLNEILIGDCLRPPCGGTAAMVPSISFQQGLLYTLTRDVTRNGGICRPCGKSCRSHRL